MTARQPTCSRGLEAQLALGSTRGEERTETLAGLCLSYRRKPWCCSDRNHPSSRAVNFQDCLLPLPAASPTPRLPVTGSQEETEKATVAASGRFLLGNTLTWFGSSSRGRNVTVSGPHGGSVPPHQTSSQISWELETANVGGSPYSQGKLSF